MAGFSAALPVLVFCQSLVDLRLVNAPSPSPGHQPPTDPDAELAKDVAKAGALGCLGGLGAFGIFALVAIVGVVIVVLVLFGLLLLTCGGH